ncbi:MAG: hypothetical protein DMG68_14645 [Acidobacteria bacterium]|jgi:predicted RNase H-like HicB family nuclease|nr:MAG: hypothetical protein DMG68_14645 [Acidobacteriota bacterium]
MTSQAIDLKVNASVPVDCKFWREDDGWIGTCDQFSLRVEGTTFEEAKRNMESALQDVLGAMVRSRESRRVA